MTLAQSIRCVFLGYDSSSTHNFMDSEAAARVGIKFSNRAGFSVAVANRDRVASSGSYTDLKINITGEPFIIACYGLSLCSYELATRSPFVTATLNPARLLNLMPTRAAASESTKL
jgi:hypothetical protein